MRLNKKILLPIPAIILVFGFLGYLITHAQMENLKNKLIHKNIQSKIHEIENAINRSSKDALKTASLFSQLPAVIKAYEIAHTGNIDQEDDSRAQEAREMLRRHLAPQLNGFSEMSGQKLKLHFHLPNGRSLVRLWRDKQTKREGKWIDISDDISSFRKTVVEVNQSGKAVMGIEPGRGGFAIRGIVPVRSDHGNQLGSVEVLIDFTTAAKNISIEDGQHLILFMNSELLDITTNLQDGSKYPILGDKYVRVTKMSDINVERLISLSLLDDGSKKLTTKVYGPVSLASFPVFDYSKKQIGVMVLSTDIKQIGSMIQKGSLAIAGIIVFVLAISAAITYIIIHKMVIRPIKMAKGLAEKLALGDFTHRLNLSQIDEIGELASALNNMADRLKDMLKELIEGIQTLSVSSSDLSSISNQMADGAQQTSLRSNSVTNAAEEMSSNMNSVSSAAEQASSNINIIASSAEQMSATINEIANSSENAQHISQGAVSQAKKSSESVGYLGIVAQEINKVTETITEISEQTNLLALNATIEAARAGEAGKGFAVVATEIKALAHQTSKATDQIRKKIEDIQSSISTTVDDIEQVPAVISEVNEVVSTIASAIEEQSITTKEIASNVAQMSIGITEVTQNVAKSSSVSKDIANDIADVNREAIDMAESSKHVSNNSTELFKLADQLKEMVAAFRLT